MPESNAFDVVVVGSGIAGLSAAVAAAQDGGRVALVERAPREERGGQTRYTEAYLRMKSEEEVTDDFELHFANNAGYYLDPDFIREAGRDYESWSSLLKGHSFADTEVVAALAAEAGPTIGWLKSLGVKFDFLPTQFLTKSQPRLLPVGGGAALIEALAAAAETLGIVSFYDTTARSLIQDEDGAVVGLVTVGKGNKTVRLMAPSVILGCGGFEGSAEMMTRYVGPRSVYLRPVCRGAYYNKGEGIQMALDIGAAPNGDFGSYHAEPIDPRSGVSEPSVFAFPYGILVNREGVRFTDEAPGPVDANYENVTRKIYVQPEGIAYAIFDRRLKDVPNYRIALRTDQPAIEANTIAELAAKLDIPAEALEATVAAYNAACPTSGTFLPLEPDALATDGLTPQKSNWARPIDDGPFQAYPIISANVFTFGGLKVDPNGRVLNRDGEPIPGLYAAGETMGIYYKVYPGGTSVLKGAVFGRLSGQHAAKRCGAAKAHAASVPA
ncbi:FAD-dependent tricarballylate dehydrogenase TcuA [Acuticoccus kandeliae]|uniref:FAD-dependent tricarballylate dehydrogenase TcuA n=1 Tax=Acuticoccus kandeliae TaxID=2073160 RepID=UPI000D3E92CE|nr:FAD-dependent tricarballylate dehydrogenase TcuA [Acuticoccus kandeliae]